jgi:hypothetical protein
VNYRPLSYTTSGAALVAALAVAIYFGAPEPKPTALQSATPVVPVPQSAPAPGIATIPEPEVDRSISAVPERMREIIERARTKGASTYWADAIELAFTEGFAAAVDHLRKFVPAEQLDEKISNLLALVGQERLEFLSEGLPLIHDPRQRSYASSSIINSWARKDALKLAAYATEHFSADQKNRAFELAVEALGKDSRFNDAQTVLNQMPASSARTRTIESLAHRWGKVDVGGGFAWARQFASAEDRLKAERTLIGEACAGASLERLQELATLYATEETRITWDSAIGQKLVATDVAAAAAWAETLQPASRDRLRQRVAVKVAETDLAQGTALALRLKSSSAIDEIHHALWQKDMRATTDWMWTLPDEYQHRVVVGIVMQWYRADEPAATAWVESLPAGGVRDRAMMWLAWEVDRAHPGTGGAVASKIADPKFKETAFNELPSH